MTCDDVVLQLGDEALSAEAREHLTTCPACQAAARTLALASLPPPSPAETASLQGLASATLSAWTLQERQAARRRGWLAQGLRLGLAAGVGALLASGMLLSRGQPGAAAPAQVGPAAELASAEEGTLLDDEGFFDVSWPEGDTP